MHRGSAGNGGKQSTVTYSSVLAEAVLEALLDIAQVFHAASAGGFAADGLVATG